MLDKHIPLVVIVLAVISVFSRPAPGQNPGTILVVGEQPTKLQIPIPRGVDYKLTFPSDKISVYKAPTSWFSGRPYPNSQLSPNTVYKSGQGVFGDVNGDGVVRTDDLIAMRNKRGTNDPLSDLDDNGQVDEEDIVAARLCVGTAANTVTLYVDGMQPSTTLGDVHFDVLTDPESDGTFASIQAFDITILSVTISAEVHDDFGNQGGALGSLATVTISPAITPLAFDSTTTATWKGYLYGDDILDFWGEYYVYVPPAPEYTVTQLSAAQVHEQSSSEAVFILGDGTKTSGEIGGVPPNGWMCGPLELHFGSYTVSKTCSLYTWMEWCLVGGGYGAPGTPIEEYGVAGVNRVSKLPLESANGVHYLLCMAGKNNSLSTQIAPPMLPVTIVTYDDNFQTVDKKSIWLFPGLDDFGPDWLPYYSDYRKPIIFVDGPVNEAEHPNLTIIRHAPQGGGFYVLLY